MKRTKNNGNFENRKGELLRKIEENYLNYMKGQVKKGDIPLPPRRPSDAQKEKEYSPPAYVPNVKKSRESLIQAILNMKEYPENNPPPTVRDRVTGETPRKEEPSAPRQDVRNNKISLDSFDLGDEEILHQIEQEVARLEGTVRSPETHRPTEQDEQEEPLEIKKRQEELEAKKEKARDEEEEYPEGAILSFNGRRIGIYVSSIPGKDFDLIYTLKEDGTVEPEGIPLYSYEHRKIGKLNPERIKALKTRMRWSREEIVYYLDEFEYANLIPTPEIRKKPVPTTQEKTEARETITTKPPRRKKPTEGGLDRGRKIIIHNGKSSWESVYWGADNQGPIVAHKTSGRWELMHLDLSRFGDRISYGNLLSNEELSELEKAVKP